MPPFYIGYSSTSKVLNGYHGTVQSKKYKQIWNKELHDNPHLFKTNIISLHDSKSEASDKEYQLQIRLKVHKNPMYINLGISGKKFFCVGHSKETREKMSKNASRSQLGLKGELSTTYRFNLINPMLGKKHSNFSKQKMSESRRGKSQSFEHIQARSKNWVVEYDNNVVTVTNLKLWCFDHFKANKNSAYSSLARRGKYYNYVARKLI